MSLLLYTLTVAAVLWLCHRFISPISRPAALILYLLPFCFTGFALLTDRVYGPIDFPYVTEPLLWMKNDYGIGQIHNGIQVDLVSQMIPWRKAVQWALSRGEWPLLNPFILSGDILAAAAQPAAYSPFTLLALLLPIAKGLTYSAAIAFFVAAISAYLFARELGCSESGALVSAAAWMYSTGLSFFILWPLGFSWAYLPLVLLATRTVVRAPGVAAAMLLTMSLALMLLAGHPETVLHIVAVGGAYALFELARVRRQIVKAIVAGVAAGVVSLMMTAIYLLPVLHAVTQTLEHRARTEFFATQPRGVVWQDALARVATDFFPFLHVRPWRVPAVGGIPIDSAAVGGIALALAIYAVWRIRSPETWFFGGLALFGLLSRSEWTPVARTMQKLPLFDIALNERFSFAAALALSILAGFAITNWERRGLAITMCATLVALTIGTILIQRANVVGPNPELWGEFKIAAELCCLALAGLVVLAPIPSRTVASILLGLILLQRTATEGGVYRVLPARAAYPPVPIFEPLKNIPEPFRVTGIQLTFIPGTSAMYELEDVRGYQAMTNFRYFSTYRLWCNYIPVWFNRVDDLTKPFLSFLNVRYAVVWGKYPLPEGWRAVAQQRGSQLYENLNVIERAFIPRKVRLGFSDTDALLQMGETKDFREIAWIRASLEPHDRDNGPGEVHIRRGKLGYDLDVTMQNPGWVVVSNVAWDGWRAYIDGRRVQLQIANTAFLGVYVPQGKHRVRLVFLPERFVIGRTVSFVTLVGVAMFFILRRRFVNR